MEAKGCGEKMQPKCEHVLCNYQKDDFSLEITALTEMSRMNACASDLKECTERFLKIALVCEFCLIGFSPIVSYCYKMLLSSFLFLLRIVGFKPYSCETTLKI